MRGAEVARQVLPLESPLLHLAASSLCQSLPAGGRRAGAQSQAPAQGPAPPSPGQNQEDRRKGCLVPNRLEAASLPAGVGGVPILLSKNVVTALETQKLPVGGLEGIQTPRPCQRRHFHMGVCTQGEAGGGSRDGEDPEPQTPPHPVALFLGWLCLLGGGGGQPFCRAPHEPGAVLRIHGHSQTCAVFILLLPVGKLRSRVVESLGPGHTARKHP